MRKNLFIISSVINISNKPLSYTRTRSVYSPEQRFQQTIGTIKSIREKMDDVDILFLESSNIDKRYEDEIKNLVDYYYLVYDNIKEQIDGIYKASGEATQIYEGIKIIDINNYKNVFKISGRYRLSDRFDYNEYDNESNVFFETDDQLKLATVFYKIYDKNLYIDVLHKCSSSKGMLEMEFKNGFVNNFKKIEILGVEGNVSIDGNYINW